MNTRSATLLAAFLLTAAFVSGGCVVVVPSPPMGIHEITAEALAQLKPGETTRVDVLMTLGDPTRRLEGDRVFCYDWSEIHWVGAIAVPGGGEPIAFGDRHRLAIEFSEAGTIARLQQFSRYSPPTLDADFDAWVKQGAEGNSK